MARHATGQVIERRGKRGVSFGLRFRAYGQRHYVTSTAATREHAERELAHILADVERGIWQPYMPELVEAPVAVPTFHDFAERWLGLKAPELGPATIADYQWALEKHLLPVFGRMRLDEITKRTVDEFAAAKLAEGQRLAAEREKSGGTGPRVGLSARTVNKVLTRLAQILGEAVEWDLIGSNPAAGGKRRVKASPPRRPSVEPEQLMALLEVAAPMYGGRGRPLLATLAGAGLRIGEALALAWADVNLARGTITVRASKTDAGRRVVDLPSALREELVEWRATTRHASDTDAVFATSTGGRDGRQNVNERLVRPAVSAANKRLHRLGIEPIDVGLRAHGLRRTYASLRAAVGDDPAYVSTQIGHTDPTFTLRVYVTAAKRRERLTEVERQAFDRAIAWAQWAQAGTNRPAVPATVAVAA